LCVYKSKEINDLLSAWMSKAINLLQAFLHHVREVIGEVSFYVTSSFPNGKGISAIATSFEKKRCAPNLMVLQGVLTSSNIDELGPSFKLWALKLEQSPQLSNY
jgi:hypothetical protein